MVNLTSQYTAQGQNASGQFTGEPTGGYYGGVRHLVHIVWESAIAADDLLAAAGGVRHMLYCGHDLCQNTILVRFFGLPQ